jgi:hypothetical protein
MDVGWPANRVASVGGAAHFSLSASTLQSGESDMNLNYRETRKH